MPDGWNFKGESQYTKEYEFDNRLDVMESFFWFKEEFPLQIALFEFQTDKDIDKPSMKIPSGTDVEAIESPLAVMFALPEYRRYFKEWQQKNVTTIMWQSRRKNSGVEIAVGL